jgi:hypothetical protein
LENEMIATKPSVRESISAICHPERVTVIPSV